MFDFDTPVSRRHTDSLKWDLEDCRYPMWVADMDFAAAPPIRAALEAKLATGVYGYQLVPADFAPAIADWWRTRHGWAVDPSWVVFCTGIVPAITTLVQCLTEMDDGVVMLTPVYDIFYHSVENMGRHVLECPLSYDGVYSIDWVGLESQLARPEATLFILCNPHNPTGQVWTENDLTSIGNLCQKYGVTVVSDEIHCDLTIPSVDYFPYGRTPLGDRAVVCVSASKAFNLAGLQGAAVIVPDADLHRRVERALNAHEVAEPNVLATVGTIAAFREGAAWLDELRAYLYRNRLSLADYLARELPEAHVVDQQATYLMWVDMSRLVSDTRELCDYLRSEHGVWVTAGAQYRGNGGIFVRINVACPRAHLLDGLRAFVEGTRRYLSRS